MISRLASQRAICRNSGLCSSYAEISRFVRTRHHGITIARPVKNELKVRCFTSTTSLKEDEISDGFLQTLDEYKKTSKSFKLNPDC